MGVQPPDNDELADGPDVVEFGIAAVDAHLEGEDLTYPVERSQLRRQYGEVEVPFDAAGRTVELDTVLAAVDSQTFDSERELLNELHPVFEEHRASSSTRLLDQLRSLLPF